MSSSPISQASKWLVIILALYAVVGPFLARPAQIWANLSEPQHYNDVTRAATSKEQNTSYCTLDTEDLKETLIFKRQQQEGVDCQDRKFILIIPEPRGFGAMLFTLVAAVGPSQFLNNRTVVVAWPWESAGFMAGVQNSSACPNNRAGNAWECYFEPISPCSVETVLDIAGAKTLDDVPLRDFPGRNKAGDEDLQVIKTKGFAHYSSNSIPKALHQFMPVNSNVNALSNFEWSDPIKSQMVRYLTRFNSPTLELLRPWFKQAMDTLADVEPQQTVGLMIRGSDKCNEDVSGKREVHESHCLPFRAYMDAMNKVWQWDNRVNTVLVTSEDERYIRAVKAFAAASPPPGFERITNTSSSGDQPLHKFTFKFNEVDVTQGTSLIHNAIAAGKLTEHFDVIKSMWTTIELLMRTRYLIINCNSFFHSMVLSYRLSSCKHAGPPPVVFCLDHNSEKDVAGISAEQVKKGGDYPGRWTYYS